MNCAYCKKRIGWVERLLIKCRLIHNCKEKVAKEKYKYAVFPGFRKDGNGDLTYISAQKLISQYKLKASECLIISTPQRKAAYANIIKDLKIISA